MLEQSNQQNLFSTLKALLHCRRRLSQQSASIALSKQQYDQEGLLLNKKTRALLAVLELVGKNQLIPLLSKYMVPSDRAQWVVRILRECGVRCMESAQQVMSNVEWLVLMAYMLGWNKKLTFLEPLLGLSQTYTEEIEQMVDASYAVEGYLFLATFTIKAVKILSAILMTNFNARSPKPPQVPPNPQKEGTGQWTCRICCGEVRNRSSTPCGHLFCWSCIIHALEDKAECPVCCSPCQPRSVIQLRNY